MICMAKIYANTVSCIYIFTTAVYFLLLIPTSIHLVWVCPYFSDLQLLPEWHNPKSQTQLDTWASSLASLSIILHYLHWHHPHASCIAWCSDALHLIISMTASIFCRRELRNHHRLVQLQVIICQDLQCPTMEGDWQKKTLCSVKLWMMYVPVQPPPPALKVSSWQEG